MELSQRRRRALLLRLARFGQTEERSGIVRIAIQICTKDLLRFGRLSHAQQRRPKSLSRGVKPVGWFVIVERVLRLDGTPIRGQCRRAVPARLGDPSVEYSIGDLRQVLR